MDRDKILRTLFTKAIEDTIETLPYTIQVFQDQSLYDLKKSISNDTDFLLGAFFAQVLLFYSVYCSNKDMKPTIEESQQFNYELFSKAEEYKTMIKELIRINTT